VELFFYSPICLHGVQRDNFTFLYVTVARDERLIWNTASSPVTGLGWPRGFQEVKVTRFLDNGTGWW
jgi:hypothetical protein